MGSDDHPYGTMKLFGLKWSHHYWMRVHYSVELSADVCQKA